MARSGRRSPRFRVRVHSACGDSGRTGDRCHHPNGERSAVRAGASGTLSAAPLRTTIGRPAMRIATVLVYLALPLLVIGIPDARAQSVIWTDTVNVAFTNGFLQKTAGCDGC